MAGSLSPLPGLSCGSPGRKLLLRLMHGVHVIKSFPDPVCAHTWKSLPGWPSDVPNDAVDCPGAKSTYLHDAAEVRLTLEDGDLEVGAAFVRFPSLTAQKPRLLHLLSYW